MGQQGKWYMALIHGEGRKTRLPSNTVREDFYQSVWHQHERQIYTNTKLWKYWQVNFVPLKGTKLWCGRCGWLRVYRRRKWERNKRRFAGASVWWSVAICRTRFIRKIGWRQMPEKRERQGGRVREGEGSQCLRFESAQIKFIDTTSLRWLLLLICVEKSATDPVFSLTAVNNFIWLIPSYSQPDESFTGQSRASFGWIQSHKNGGRIKGRRKEAAPLSNPQPT